MASPASATTRTGVASVARFAASFRAQHGRAPRVLHIGNIANNAYNNAKLLNNGGFDCDVLCYDYYHVMGCPEWEDADFAGEIADPLAPDWRRVDLRGFERPRWFVQGPLSLCFEYLLVKRANRVSDAERLWRQLGAASRFPVEGDNEVSPDESGGSGELSAGLLHRLRRRSRRVLSRLTSEDVFYVIWEWLGTRRALAGKGGVAGRAVLAPFFGVLSPVLMLVLLIARSLQPLKRIVADDDEIYDATWWQIGHAAHRHGMLAWMTALLAAPLIIGGLFTLRILGRPFLRRRWVVSRQSSAAVEELCTKLCRLFAERFPERPDTLSAADIRPYMSTVPLWRTLFAHYDFVCAYSTDAIWPLLAEHRPYIAYEHGTIRDIPYEQTATGRLCALAYGEAPVVYLTNADSLGHARALGPRNIVFGFHGFDADRLAHRVAMARQAQPDTRFVGDSETTIFLAPARHHWRDGFASWRKGNDLVIRAVAKLAALVPGRFRVIFVDWGAEVDLSKQLIAELNCGEYFQWVPPLPKADLLKAYAFVDCVIDQFVLPCIGSVTFEAIAIGRAPVITALDDAVMENHYGASVPLFNCATVEQVFDAMLSIITDRNTARARARESHEWFLQRHNAECLGATLVDAFERCAEKEGARRAAI